MKKLITFLNIVFITANVFGQTANIIQSDIKLLFEDRSMIGVLGNDCSRIDIHFSKAKKINELTYRINGASRTRLQIICQFEGEITIDSIAYIDSPKNEVEDVDGYILGKYHFVEDINQQYSGSFTGSFKQAFRICGYEVKEPINLIPINKINLSEYVGMWLSNNNQTKVCNWADAIIPCTADDFCVFNDAGEWIVSPKYRKGGWDNMYNAYFNDELSKEEVKAAQNREEKKWWSSKNSQ